MAGPTTLMKPFSVYVIGKDMIKRYSWKRVKFTDWSLHRCPRATSLKKDIVVVPLYEYLTVDYGALSETGFSLHANGWLRSDLGDRAGSRRPDRPR